MKRRVISVSLVIGLLMYAPAMALDAQYGVASSPNIVGSGARALGVGGAFIAVADDATAASWNPAALIVLRRPEAAVMVSYENRDRYGEASFFDFNYIAGSYPFSFLQRNVIFSLNYQRLVDFNSDFDESFSDLAPSTRNAGEPIYEGAYPGETWPIYTINYNDLRIDSMRLIDDVTGDVGAVAPAFAIQIVPRVSVGVTLNFWMDGVINDGYNRTYEERQNGSIQQRKIYWVDTNEDGNIDGDWVDDGDGNLEPGEGEIVLDETFDRRKFKSKAVFETEWDFFGINANIGLLVKATSNLTIGAVYKMPFTAEVNVTQTYDAWQKREDGAGGWIENRDKGKIDTMYKIRFPSTYGLGAAWRFNDNFTVSFDVAYTDYQNFVIQEYVDTGERAKAGVSGGELSKAGRRVSAVNGVITSKADIDGVVTARAGAEYLFILPKTIIAARGGLIYDPQPAQGGPDNFMGFSLGTGAVLYNRVALDLAYQYRFCNDATVVTIVDADGMLDREIKDDVVQHMVLLSSIFYF